MITKDNFRMVLDALGFSTNGSNKNLYYNDFGSGKNKYEMKVDFAKEKLIYAEGISSGRDTTKDFHQNENFVVFECVCRLLSLGYEPQNIILEASSGVAGRGQTQTYLDVLVRDNNGNNYLIIECKTAGKEFDDAWSKVKKNGGQLFNYWTLFGTKHLCLYASDYSSETKKLTYASNIIIFEKEDLIKDPETKQKKLTHIDALLKTNPLTKGYKDLDENANQTDYFNVWTDTYGQPELYHGIFEEGCKPYEISEKITLSYDDLKEMEDYEEIQRKYHQFATIMRLHNVGSHENSFDKLVNLFLAKIVDETDNQKELKFNWKGAAFDDYYNFQDRLQQMYSKGMSEFLGEKVEYVSDEQIDNAFKFFAKDTPELSRDEVKKLFHIQKFFTNNDFSFLDVHNEQLFMQNVAILIKVVQMLQGMKLKTNNENQFLGDLFEGFLDQGVKQSEGQFFTPIPIVKFLVSSLPIGKIVAENVDAPKVIDYACGAGHFLNEVARVIKSEADRQKKTYETKDLYGSIVGIEKEYRLSKVAKVSAFMYSQNEIQIVYGDGLIPHKNVENGSFNILVANPPYSVKGFLETLENNQKLTFSLYSDKVKTINEAATNSIETFFVERSAQLLKAGGVAAIILPSSILSNGNIYTDCRKIILQNFNIIAIAEFGSGTFGKTPTTTITLFLEKKPYGKLASEQNLSDDAVQYRNRVNAWFNGDFSKSTFFEDGHFFEEYCSLIETDYKQYQSWILGGDLPKSELFSEYDKEVKKSLSKVNAKKLTAKYTQEDKNKEIRQRTFEFIAETEKEKLYYYILSRLNRTKVIVAKSPTDNKEIKSHLGYEWSGAKGSEGIKYLGQNVVDEEDAIRKNSGILGIKTPLFNPIDKDDETKICFAIRSNFENEGVVNEICGGIELTNGSSLVVHNLCDMIDFSRASFDMQIRTIVQKKEDVVEYKFNTKFLEQILLPIKGNTTKISADNLLDEGKYPVITQEADNYISGYSNDSNPISDLPLIVFGDHTCVFKYVDTEFIRGADGTQLLKTDNKNVLTLFVYYFLQNIKIYNANKYERHFKYLKEIKIPLPPKDIQSRIVSECKELDDEATKARNMQSELKKKIENIMANVQGERKKLGDISPFTTNRISYGSIDASSYISTDNLLQNYEGVKEYYGTPNVDTVIEYKENDILVSNIRPYLKKIWFADKNGGNSPDVLVFRPIDGVNPKYIYYSMRRDSFFEWVMSDIKGMKMPRGKKETIEKFVISIPSLAEQNQIVSQLESIESEITELQKTIDSIPERKKAVLDKELLAI